MPAEWKRALWTYDAVGLGHTNVNIMNAIEAMLLGTGWERPSWDTALNRLFVRSDRRTIVLTNDAVGASGNVAITKVDPNSRITIAGMSGGSSTVKATGSIILNALDVFDANSVTISDGTNPAKVFEFEAGAAAARGKVAFLGQPADGDTVVVNDGVNPAVTFEFDSDASVVETATLRQVIIGGDLSTTLSNLSAVVNLAPTLAITANVGPLNSVLLVNDVAGVAGNVALSEVGANIVVEGMTGGGGAIGVGGGAVSVTRGATVEDTLANLVAAINGAASLNVTAKWQNRWTFNGDGPWQHCGIHVFNDTVNATIVIRTFLQFPSGYGNQISSFAAHQIEIVYSDTAPNTFQFYAGEYGFFGECGRDGEKVNLAHWFIATFEPMPELFGTDDARVFWTSQGVPMDLFGDLKFTATRNQRFSVADAGNRNFTSNLQPRSVRGHQAVSFDTPVVVDDSVMSIGPMDNVLGAAITQIRDGSMLGTLYTFGLSQTPRDGKYRISPMLLRQSWGDWVDVGVNAGDGFNFYAPDTTLLVFDIRRWRRMAKFAVVDHTLIPFVNLIDEVTGIEYYVSQIADGGRTANLAIEYTADTVSIPATP
jgi:hypothetical protein